MNLGNKSQMKAVIGIIILIFSLISVGLVLKKFTSESETTQAETICRASVATRAKYSGSGYGVDLTPPLLCKSHSKKITPSGGDLEEEKESVMKELSDLAARCWWTFGNGLVEKVLPSGFYQESKCFVCYSAKIKPGNYLKDEESISNVELSGYMFNQPYKSISLTDSCYLGGGNCIVNTDECGGNHPFYSALGTCPPGMDGNPKKLPRRQALRPAQAFWGPRQPGK